MGERKKVKEINEVGLEHNPEQRHKSNTSKKRRKTRTQEDLEAGEVGLSGSERRGKPDLNTAPDEDRCRSGVLGEPST